MATRASRQRLRSGFTLGGEQAEADPLLSDAFYESGDYEGIVSKHDPRCFVTGRTGSGKSAAFQQLEKTQGDHVIRIAPEDLSLPYITDLHVFRYLDSLNVHLDLLFIALWKHVLLVEILRHRYSIDSPVAKQNFLAALRQKLSRDPAKRAALDYLDEFEGKFWCEADERVREITDKFEKRVEAEMGGQASLPGLGAIRGGADVDAVSTSEVWSQQADRFQRIVNETQLARLNKMIAILDEDILDGSQHFTYIVIDDLDRDWVDERLANDLIRCLFRTVLDLKRVRNIKVLVALRTNIFEQLEFSGQAGAQEEKFRSLVLEMRWTRQELVGMLDERARASSELRGLQNTKSVKDLLPTGPKKLGNSIDFVLDRTLMRPRDAIAYLNEALALAGGKTRIAWKDLNAAELRYSQKRLLALRDEWKMSYPDIDKIFAAFRGARLPLDRDTFTKYLDDAILVMAQPDFRGVRWLTDLTESVWSSGGSDHDWVDLYQPLTQFLYHIGFVGCSRAPTMKPKYSHEDAAFADSPTNLNETCCFFVHDAFRPALEIRA